MFGVLWRAAIPVRDFFQKWMPTNVLLRALRTRRGLNWGIPAMALGAAYVFLAAVCIVMINHGWSGWLYLLFALFLWNGLKFLIFGPISLIHLIRARHAEERSSRTNRPGTTEDASVRV